MFLALQSGGEAMRTALQMGQTPTVSQLWCLRYTWLLIWYVGRCGLMRGGMFGVFMRWSHISHIRVLLVLVQAPSTTCHASDDHPSHPSRGRWDWGTMGSHWRGEASRASGEGVGSEVWRGSCHPELRCSCVENVEMRRVLPVSAVGCWIQVDLRWSKDIQVQVSYFILLLRILSPIAICKHTSPTEVANTNSDEIRNHILEGAQVIFSTTTVAGQSLGSRVG